MTAETWRPIPSLPGREASDLGRIRTFTRGQAGKILAGYTDTRGYVQHSFEYHNRYAHRLVLEAFVGPQPAGMVTRHLDGNPSNNTLSNLAYGTQRENVHDTLRHGTHAGAAKTHCLRGHLYDEANTAWGKKGGRLCLTCRREAHARHRAARELARSLVGA